MVSNVLRALLRNFDFSDNFFSSYESSRIAVRSALRKGIAQTATCFVDCSNAKAESAAVTMLCYKEIKTALNELTKQCHSLWEENKDMQGRFVNDLAELHRMQLAINEVEREKRFFGLLFFKKNLVVISGRKFDLCRVDELSRVRQKMREMQAAASQLYSSLMEKRNCIVQKLNDGVHNVAVLQNHLISDRLYAWKDRQKLLQTGVPFDKRERLLDSIQKEYVVRKLLVWKIPIRTRCLCLQSAIHTSAYDLFYYIRTVFCSCMMHLSLKGSRPWLSKIGS